MGLFNFNKKQKTWQELKLEQEEAERIKTELNKLNELNKIDATLPKDSLSEEELKRELKKFPRKKRKHLRELYIQYQKGKVLQVGNDINNKEYMVGR
jgi:DNA-binding protein H-NS